MLTVKPFCLSRMVVSLEHPVQVRVVDTCIYRSNTVQGVTMYLIE